MPKAKGMLVVPSGLDATAFEAPSIFSVPTLQRPKSLMISEPCKDEGSLQTMKTRAKPRWGSEEEPREMDVCRASANTG